VAVDDCVWNGAGDGVFGGGVFDAMAAGVLQIVRWLMGRRLVDVRFRRWRRSSMIMEYRLPYQDRDWRDNVFTLFEGGLS